MLKVQIGREETAPFELRESAEIFFGQDLAQKEKLVGEFEVFGEIVNDGKIFVAKGKSACQRNFFCDRCLEPSSGKVDCEFEEELTYEEIVDNVADITELVRDTFLAALPMRNLCREDCKGLCPVCGKNLNNEDCECERLEVDPRLAVLRNLKLD